LIEGFSERFFSVGDVGAREFFGLVKLESVANPILLGRGV